MNYLFNRNKGIKVTALVRSFTHYAGLDFFKRQGFSKFRCVDEKRCSVGVDQTKMGFMPKWKLGIDEIIDQLILNKRLILKWFYFSMFAYILCSTNLTQYTELYRKSVQIIKSEVFMWPLFASVNACTISK